MPVRPRLLTRFTALLFLACNGCAYHGAASTDIDNPAVQKFSWFSFLDGNDIRQACASLGPQAPAHYRLVYNGQYSEQIRAYEIVGEPSGGAALTARAKGHSSLSGWWIAGTQDLLAPWRWHESTAALSAAEMAQFRAALTASGFGSGAPQGLRLASQDFYWVAAGCEAGQFHYYAWVEKDGRLDAAKFQDFLLRHDGTGLPLRPPHVLSIEERQRLGTAKGRNFNGEFTLEVRGEGLGGLINAF
ncbi:MAG TPA: hypothetical protein VHE77_15465 [Dongiaceae bacterium]|nr:hypothetical protein [Dongiaceae bacterium]